MHDFYYYYYYLDFVALCHATNRRQPANTVFYTNSYNYATTSPTLSRWLATTTLLRGLEALAYGKHPPRQPVTHWAWSSMQNSYNCPDAATVKNRLRDSLSALCSQQPSKSSHIFKPFKKSSNFVEILLNYHANRHSLHTNTKAKQFSAVNSTKFLATFCEIPRLAA